MLISRLNPSQRMSPETISLQISLSGIIAMRTTENSRFPQIGNEKVHYTMGAMILAN
jgi:hypothetical protein